MEFSLECVHPDKKESAQFTNAGVLLSTSPDGIVLTGTTNALVGGKRIGTDVTGLVALPNAGVGVRVGGTNTALGDATYRNVISGNVVSGNLIDGILLNPPVDVRFRNEHPRRVQRHHNRDMQPRHARSRRSRSRSQRPRRRRPRPTRQRSPRTKPTRTLRTTGRRQRRR